MAIFGHSRDEFDIHDEVAALRREVSALSRAASKRGAAAYGTASEGAADLYAEIADRVIAALPGIRRRAHDLEETIRDNPTRTVAAVGLATLAVAAVVLLGRRR
jgi:hypothetical protein